MPVEQPADDEAGDAEADQAKRKRPAEIRFVYVQIGLDGPDEKSKTDAGHVYGNEADSSQAGDHVPAVIDAPRGFA